MTSHQGPPSESPALRSRRDWSTSLDRDRPLSRSDSAKRQILQEPEGPPAKRQRSPSASTTTSAYEAPPSRQTTSAMSQDPDGVTMLVDVERSRIHKHNLNVDTVRTALPSSAPTDLPRTPSKTPRYQDPMAPDRGPSAPERLPLFPAIADSLSQLSEEVLVSRPELGKKGQAPLPTGVYPTPAKPFQPRFLAPKGHPDFCLPAVLQDELSSLSVGASLSRPGVEEAPLLTEERWLREILCTMSSLQWLQETTRTLAEKSQEVGPEDARILLARLKEVGTQAKSLELDLTDRLTTKLAATILQRRDIHLATLKGAQDPSILQRLRASPLMSGRLFAPLEKEEVARTKALQQESTIAKVLETSVKSRPPLSTHQRRSAPSQRGRSSEPPRQPQGQSGRRRETPARGKPARSQQQRPPPARGGPAQSSSGQVAPPATQPQQANSRQRGRSSSRGRSGGKGRH